MRITFGSDSQKQNGVFKYLNDRYGTNMKNFVEIYGTNYADSSLFAIVNDSYNGRYRSATENSLYFSLLFRGFSVKITHYALRNWNNWCLSKEWNIYGYTKKSQYSDI